MHRRGPRRVRVVVAGAGAHEGCVGYMWDSSSMLRGGWACQRGQGTSRGMGHVLGGHGATHCVSPSVRWFAWMQGWQRRVVGVRTRAHKHGGYGRCDIMAATKQGEDAHTQRAAKAKRIDEKGVVRVRPHLRPTGPPTSSGWTHQTHRTLLASVLFSS